MIEANLWGRIRSVLYRTEKPIGTYDMKIAGHAKGHNNKKGDQWF